MDTEVLVVLGSLVVQAIGIYTQHNMTKYRIQQLEERVNKHNNVIERTYVLEGKVREAEGDIDELKGKVR